MDTSGSGTEPSDLDSPHSPSTDNDFEIVAAPGDPAPPSEASDTGAAPASAREMADNEPNAEASAPNDAAVADALPVVEAPAPDATATPRNESGADEPTDTTPTENETKGGDDTKAEPMKPAVLKPAAPCDLGFFSRLPPQVKELVLYDKPAHSGAVLGVLLVLYALLFIDLGFSLLWLGAFVGKYTLAIALVPTVAKEMYDKYVQGKAECTPLAKSVVEPLVDKALAECAPYIPSAQQIEAFVARMVRRELPSLAAEAREVLYCTSWLNTTKAIGILYIASKIGRVVSFPGLALILLLLLFSVPKAYSMKKKEVHMVLDTATAKLSDVHDKIHTLLAPLLAKIKRD